MLNASFDRDAICVKIFGVISGLAAIGSLVILLFGGTIGSLFIALTEVISLFSGKGTFASSYTNTIISIITHLGMIAYILWNRISRNQAMWIGAVCVGDILWKTIMIPSTLRRLSDLYGLSGLDASTMNGVIGLVVISVLVTIIPACAVTLFLFTGALDYGN